MTKRMLIDATHPEETRVVVVDGNRLDDFDFETAAKKQLKGNIYLARITRVEPSLQAAFVEYGGNRHGFLAFSEIHPDYYRIPIEDREALLREERAEAYDEDEDEDAEVEETGGEHPGEPEDAAEGGDDGEEGDDEVPASTADVTVQTKKSARPETVGGDAMEEVRRRRKPSNRRYKIQEVVTRRQIMLVQVVKEERGNKGAALTTYLSLAGRYCVLMPNTARGGGVSRKITHAGDRKRLKQIVEGLDVPEGMAVIVRTAGSQRTKAEIKRDYEYLLRLWDEIRSTTLDSTAPCLIYEEANLIKRSIRDLYTRDLDEVLVDGDDGYRIAKDFMKTLIPSHAKRVKRYNDTHVPLLHRFQVESQLDAIHSPIVELKSGGYIVLNQTEALVAIDVNSGRSTSERNIEETALKTNLEAADEVARQLRLRDLAGLVVIDYIDMEESRNQHAVERRMKEAMKSDRARIQIGRISHFGLMELSRQRLRPSLVEASTQVCPHCKGSGYIRSIESTALHILRVIEEEGLRNRAAEISVHVPAQVALYILNHKRERLAEIEARYGTRVILEQDDSLVPPDHRVERGRPKTAEERAAFQNAVAAGAAAIEDDEPDDFVDEDEDEDESGDEAANENESRGEEQDEGRGRGRSRRRRRGGRRRPEDRADEAREQGEDDEDAEGAEGAEGSDSGDEAPAGERSGEEDDESAESRKRRRRGRRGGRRRSRRREDGTEGPQEGESEQGESDQGESGEDGFEDGGEFYEDTVADSDTDGAAEEVAAVDGMQGEDALPAAAAESSAPAEIAAEAPVEAVAEAPSEAVVETPSEAVAEAPSEVVVETPSEVVVEAPSEAVVEEAPAPKKPRRRRTKKDLAAEEAAKEAAAAAEAEAAAAEAAAAPVEEAVAEAPVPEVVVSEAPVAEEVASAESSEAISGETGEDLTAAEEPEGEQAEPVQQNLSSVPIEVRTLDKPVEKPRKGWWRR